METMFTEKEYMCKFCNKKFPSGKSLGGHIRIHTKQFPVHSNSNSGNKRLFVEQREITALKQQLCCRECGKGFESLKDLWSHMDCCHCEGEKLLMDSHSDTETTRKRSKKHQSSSDSFSSSSSSACESIEQEHKNTALSLMMMSMDSKGLTLVVNSLVAESSDNNSDDDDCSVAILSDLYSSDSDYFMNGPKKLDSVEELGVKEGRSNYEISKGKRVVLPPYETDSCADSNIKIHSKSSLMVKKAKNSKGHECPICFRVFKSGQALGGHKRSHSFVNQQQHKAAAAYMQIDLNLPAQDI